MEIFNVGILEFLLLLLLAFIILGPKKAVEMAGTVGRWVKGVTKSPIWKEIVNTSKDIKDIPRKIMDDVEVKNTLEEIERSTRAVNAQIQQSSLEQGGMGKILPPDTEVEKDDPPGQSINGN